MPTASENPIQPERLHQREVFYFNGFAIGFGNADFSITIKLDNQELLELKASYTVGKTFAGKLTELVARFEQITNHKVMTTEEIHEALTKSQISNDKAE